MACSLVGARRSPVSHANARRTVLHSAAPEEQASKQKVCSKFGRSLEGRRASGAKAGAVETPFDVEIN